MVAVRLARAPSQASAKGAGEATAGDLEARSGTSGEVAEAAARDVLRAKEAVVGACHHLLVDTGEGEDQEECQPPKREEDGKR